MLIDDDQFGPVASLDMVILTVFPFFLLESHHSRVGLDY
jgi:hypothetical protein